MLLGDLLSSLPINVAINNTLAHSITLTDAALGYLSLPQAPVRRGGVALSIAFVARELTLMKPGERRLSEAY